MGGARQSKACEALGLSERTLQRWIREGNVQADKRKSADRAVPTNKLTEEEQQTIVDVCNSDRFKSLPPSQIVPILADEGVYIGSESSFYRTLLRRDMQHHRGRAAKANTRKPTSYYATGPNQVWSWDITFLRSPVYASKMITRACLRHSIAAMHSPLVLHSDNGSAMKGGTMLSTLQRLGVVGSFSRPRVSDDNPFAEAIFRTLKYRSGYPAKPFADLDAARGWVHGFAQWYNEEHRHSGLKFLTPGQRHRGESEELMANRKQVYRLARQRHPERWGKRSTRNWDLPSGICLNPDRQATGQLDKTG